MHVKIITDLKASAVIHHAQSHTCSSTARKEVIAGAAVAIAPDSINVHVCGHRAVWECIIVWQCMQGYEERLGHTAYRYNIACICFCPRKLRKFLRCLWKSECENVSILSEYSG